MNRLSLPGIDRFKVFLFVGRTSSDLAYNWIPNEQLPLFDPALPELHRNQLDLSHFEGVVINHNP